MSYHERRFERKRFSCFELHMIEERIWIGTQDRCGKNASGSKNAGQVTEIVAVRI